MFQLLTASYDTTRKEQIRYEEKGKDKIHLSQSGCVSFGAELFPWAGKCQQKAKWMRVRICRLKTPGNAKQK